MAQHAVDHTGQEFLEALVAVEVEVAPALERQRDGLVHVLVRRPVTVSTLLVLADRVGQELLRESIEIRCFKELGEFPLVFGVVVMSTFGHRITSLYRLPGSTFSSTPGKSQIVAIFMGISFFAPFRAAIDQAFDRSA
jgi:hypothetical protein